MKKLLFVNACARSEKESRTWQLCNSYIKAFLESHSDYELEEIRLYESEIHCYGLDEINARNELIQKKQYDDEMFSFARQFAKADSILVGAPYWDLSFPAILKAYVETVCVNGISFHYTAHGAEGLSKFESMCYLTTSGGYNEEKKFGADYMKAVAQFLGNGQFSEAAAYGLDVIGNDVEAILSAAKTTASDMATWVR